MKRGDVITFAGVTPALAPDVFVAAGARIVGNVTIGPASSIWFNVVLRGDVAAISIGSGSNVQDNSLLHVDEDQPCMIGNNVTIGHSAIVHAATVGDGALIGMGAIVLSRATIGEGAIVAAGSLVPEGAVVEPFTLVMGSPARFKRQLAPDERERGAQNSARYQLLATRYEKDPTANDD